MLSASAPGKIILFGEHAVVYGEPAIAVPVGQLAARAEVEPAAHDGILLRAPDLGEAVWLHEAPADHPLGAAVEELIAAGRASGRQLPTGGITISVTSTIPIASGLGSGAAIAAALIRALALYWGWDELATDAAVSSLTFNVERIHHGTPSGIDNTVVSYKRPVFFARAGGERPQRMQPLLETFEPAVPLHFLIADTGLKAPTHEPVGDVRRLWLADPPHWEAVFAACGRIAQDARQQIEAGNLPAVGRLMIQNHALLQQMTVSAPILDQLVDAALQAGALGAKLSGGGRGGNMITLVTPDQTTEVRAALVAGGAKRVIEMVVKRGKSPEC